jgi:F-type H+-transporting ATPase subunit b
MIGEILGKLGFDWKVALANLVNFLIIFYLLRNVVFKKLGKTIKERQEKIQKGLDDAKRAEGALVMAESKKEEILKDAQRESRKITENADIEGKKIVAEAKSLADEEAQKIKEAARLASEREKTEAQKKLEKEYVAMVLDGVEKILKNGIDRIKSEKFAEGLLK